MKNTHKGSTTIVLTIILLIVGFGTYIYLQNSKVPSSPLPTLSPTVTNQSQTADTGYATYSTDKFSIQYPSNWIQEKVLKVVIFKSPKSVPSRPINVAISVTSSDSALNAAQQIAQFSKIKSLSARTIKIAGVTATEFTDTTSSLAPASFVIFEKDGYLYNLSTAGIDSALSQKYYESLSFKK